jgi:hypothetical protein
LQGNLYKKPKIDPPPPEALYNLVRQHGLSTNNYFGMDPDGTRKIPIRKKTNNNNKADVRSMLNGQETLSATTKKHNKKKI